MGCEPKIEDWCCPVGCLPDLTDAEKQTALTKAIETIGALLGPQYTRCETNVFRPCLPYCGCSTVCGCSESVRIVVPYPNLLGSQILATWVDGTRTVAGRWRTHVDGNHTIISPVDSGAGRFTPPGRQNLDADYTQTGTWGIEIQTASVPPLVAELILGVACEIAQWCRTKACDLPAGTVSITEQGVTVNLDQSMLFSDSRVPIMRELAAAVRMFGSHPAPYAGMQDVVEHGVWDLLE